MGRAVFNSVSLAAHIVVTGPSQTIPVRLPCALRSPLTVAGSLMSIDEEGFLSVMEEADARQGAENVMTFAKALLRCAKSVTMPHNGQPTSVVRLDARCCASTASLAAASSELVLNSE